MSEPTYPAGGYETVVQPSRGWMNLRAREFWEYRDLLVLLIQRDFTSRYKQTLLGPLWFVLQPVLTTIVFAIVFGRVAGIPTDGIPAPLFYLAGLLGWNYFSQNVTTAGATFVNNTHLFTKVYFPRLIMPVSTVLSNLVSMLLQLLPFLAFYLYYGLVQHASGVGVPTWHLLLLPLPLLQLVLLSLGVSLWMSASTAKFRDLVHLTQFLIQLWMFATPIIYPITQVRAKWAWLIYLNPVAVPIEAIRYCLLGRGSLLMSEVLFSAGFTLILLITGLALYQRVERTVVDHV